MHFQCVCLFCYFMCMQFAINQQKDWKNRLHNQKKLKKIKSIVGDQPHIALKLNKCLTLRPAVNEMEKKY